MLAKKSVCNYFFFQFLCLTFYFENTFVGKNESTRLPISHNFLPYFDFLKILLQNVKRNENLFYFKFLLRLLPNI